MSLFHENIKQILAEVEKFTLETLKKEKLNKKSTEHKQLIIDKINAFFEENPEMRLVPGQSSANDESTMTGGSNRSDESEDTTYAIDSTGIPFIAASDLKEPVFSAFLEKKQKKGSGLFGGTKFQSRWCVIQNGNFYYYTKQDDKKQCGAFKLAGYKFRNAPDLSSKKKEKELCLELYQDDETKRCYQFIARTKDDYEKCQIFVENGGFPLIEEDLYEDISGEVTKGLKEAEAEAGDEYEDPEANKPPGPPSPPKPPPQKDLPLPPPPPPLDSTPLGKHRPFVPEPVDQIPEDVYDDALTPHLPPVPPPPASPAGAPPVPPSSRRLRELPELPPIPKEAQPKHKLKISISYKPEEDYENKYYGAWDCTGDDDTELTFKKGDMIYVVSKEFDDKAWWVGELDGKFGLVPKAFLTPAYISVP